MSLSVVHLNVALRGGKPQRSPPITRSLEDLLREKQDSFRRPHLRWRWKYRQPVPFCWGPNGSLMLLALFVALAVAVGAVIGNLR